MVKWVIIYIEVGVLYAIVVASYGGMVVCSATVFNSDGPFGCIAVDFKS